MRLLWIEFAVLTLLVLTLISSWGRRQWRQRKPGIKTARLPGHGIDATSVNQRLMQLREDYGAVARRRPRPTPGHDQLVAAIRRSLGRLSFFRLATTAKDKDAPGEAGEIHP